MKFEIDGVQYELGMPVFGKELDSMDSMFSVNIDKDGKIETSKNLGAKTMSISTIIKCLKSWTFKGYNVEIEELVTEGPILPITGENIEKLPSSHGNYLLNKSREIVEIPETSVKNL